MKQREIITGTLLAVAALFGIQGKSLGSFGLSNICIAVIGTAQCQQHQPPLNPPPIAQGCPDGKIFCHPDNQIAEFNK